MQLIKEAYATKRIGILNPTEEGVHLFFDGYDQGRQSWCALYAAIQICHRGPNLGTKEWKELTNREC